LSSNVDPAELTADERLHELAAILAKGVLTMRPKATPASPEETPKPVRKGLDPGRGTSPCASARRGDVNARAGA